MPHIPIPEDLPGPRGLMVFRPETAKPLNELAEILLRGPSTLSRAEREMIGAFVSSQNDCLYCQSIHGALTAHLLEGNEGLVNEVNRDFRSAPISEKMRALLAIAGKVQQGGKQVKTDDVERARSLGATDLEIHDTVLIAAKFCMMNRYVDGLGAWTPMDKDFYRRRAAMLAEGGYRGSAQRHETVGGNE